MGATGKQGGGLIRAMLNHPERGLVPRGITRDLNSDAARKLVNLGVNMIKADLDDPKSIHKAFEGAYGAYCVTSFWEHMSPSREIAHARNMAKAARDTDIKHVIWSTLEDTRRWIPLDDNRMPTLMDKYKVPHFDAKGEADSIFRDLNLPVTNLLTSFYWENFIDFNIRPEIHSNGQLMFSLPIGNKKLTAIASEDIGKCAFGIFSKDTLYIGQTIGIVGEKLTGEQMADHFSELLGQPVHYNNIPIAEYRQSGGPVIEDMANMFQFMQDFEHEFGSARNQRLSRELNPELQTFKQWLSDHKKHFKHQEPEALV